MRRFLPIILVVLCCTPICSAPKDCDRWMGISLGAAKIGYMHVSLVKDKLGAKDAYKFREVMVTNLPAGNRSMPRSYSATVRLDADLRPLYGEFEVSDDSGGSRTVARFLSDRIECKKNAYGKAVTKTVKIAPGTDLSRYPAYRAGLQVGESEMIRWLNPTQLEMVSESQNVVERKEVDFAGKKRAVTVVELGRSKFKMVDWRLDSGEIIRTEIPIIGVVMTAMSRRDALAGLGASVVDLGCILCDKPIPNPRGARDLSLCLSGVPDSEFVVNDSRQSAQFSPGDGSVNYRIRAASFDAAKSVKLPIARAELEAYRKPSEGIESDDKAIISHAKEIVGTEVGAYQAAYKLRAWVQGNIKPSNEATTTLSAVDVLRKRTGCCRHNAVLYAALARAAGIPTRLAAGLICDRGAFGYHVWVESWVGEWVALDPTYPGEFVDATHVKLVQGEVEDLPSLGRLAGRLSAEIISAR